jgi:hypothetical protein
VDTSQDYVPYLLLTAHFILPFVGVAFAFFSGQRPEAWWARIMTVVACVPGVAGAAIQWFVMHARSYRLSRGVYDQLVGWRGVAAGLFLGIYLTIAVARRYTGLKDLKS